MATIKIAVLERAAILYRQLGNTWADVVKILNREGHYHSREHLSRKCRKHGLLPDGDKRLCTVCKNEFEPEGDGKAFVCPNCRSSDDLCRHMRSIARLPRPREGKLIC